MAGDSTGPQRPNSFLTDSVIVNGVSIDNNC